VAIPYGTVTPEIRFLCPPIPKALLDEFKQASREASPNEIAAQIIWNRETEEFRLQFLDYTSNGPGHIDYLSPEYGAGEVMVVDLHSHGRFDSSFSDTDDIDDAGQIKVAGVVGHCDRPNQRVSMRLCVLGMYCHMPWPQYEQKVFNNGTQA
jgi:PRTRC genetic system protein A